ncbi:MAG TPA: response regulator transcription factor [Nocardioidaceae bacterium]|jgi:DNA-binding NarL/FixJ family response regulator|nr:response regulator transcription factor [Nocardioidaceae bacterium]
MIRVLLADDHEVIRFGLRVLINATEDLELVGSAADGLAAVAMTLRDDPDVVVMDLSMPVLDGIAATAEILRHRPATRVLVLTSYANDPIVRDALDAGASGYLLKDDSSQDVIEGIRAVCRGERPMAATVARGHP